MSEVKNPEVLDVAMESLENEETAQVNYSEKSLAELADLFMELARNPERMKMKRMMQESFHLWRKARHT